MAKYPKAPKPSSTPAPKDGGYSDDGEFKETEENRRIKDVDAARSVYNRMLNDNVLRSSIFSHVRNQLEGGRPFDPAQMAQNGTEGNCNVNFGDSQADRDKTLLPYWKMVNDVPHRIAVTIHTQSPHAEVWQAAFAQCFDEFLEDWASDYFVQYMNLAQNFVNFGPGIPHWRDKDSPRWKSVNVQRVLWPKNARMSPDEWDVVAFTEDVSPSDLYLRIRTKKDREASKFAGWNIDAVKAAICSYKGGTSNQDSRDWTRWQDRLVNNDIAISTHYEPMPIIWLLVRQFSGKIGCYVFCQQGAGGEKTVNEFLFKSEDYEDDFRHILGPIWYDTGTDSMIHSIKGFGIKNYYFSVLRNRTKSRIIDAATMALTVNFQRESENVPDETPPIESYGFCNILPPGLKQLTVYPQFEQAMGVMQMLDNNATQNNSLYRDQQQSQIGDTGTAKQAEILAAMQAETSAASAAIYLSQVGENIFTEQVRRLRRKGNTDKDAKNFVERMKELNVPEEVIYNARIRVKTGANSGLANPAMRAAKFQQGLSLRGFPGINVRWFMENYIANEFGASAVSKALLPEGEDTDPAQANEATIENMMFGQGQPMKVIPQDNHAIHLQIHLEPLKAIADMAQAQQPLSPEQITALTIGIEHSSEHMQYLSQDETMKEQFMQIRPIFAQVQSVARGVLTRLAQNQRDQQQQKQQQPGQMQQPPMAIMAG